MFRLELLQLAGSPAARPDPALQRVLASLPGLRRKVFSLGEADTAAAHRYVQSCC